MALVDDPHSKLETDSTVSETSAAIVSVYNSWSSTTESSSSFYDTNEDDMLLLDNDNRSGFASSSSLPGREAMMIDSETLLQELRKRCREEDIPPIPILRRRRRPACQFLNYMGTRRHHDSTSATRAKPSSAAVVVDQLQHPTFATLHPPPLMVFELPWSNDDMDLGFEEKDALFPLFSTKAKHFNDDDHDDSAGQHTAKRPRVSVDNSNSFLGSEPCEL